MMRGRRGRNYGSRGDYQQFTTGQGDVDEVQKSTSYRKKGPITCHKCGQEGHITIGSRVRTDFQRRPLNYKKSTPGEEELAQGGTVPGNRY